MQMYTQTAMYNNRIISLSIDHMNSFIDLTVCMLIQVKLPTFSHNATAQLHFTLLCIYSLVQQ